MPSSIKSMDLLPNHNMPNNSEPFREVPKGAESFGAIPNVSEAFGRIPKAAERNENHTMTVRDAARLFENAGVARTERSIINWCQPNKMGIPRLDCYFDPNERRYFITPSSVEMAIQEELAKRGSNEISKPSPTTEPERGQPTKPIQEFEVPASKVKALEQEILDLKITNRGKDFFIDQLKQERDGMLHQVISESRKVGELENKLARLSERSSDL